MANLADVVASLSGLHGPAPASVTTDPFELILAENVAYLANDARRAEAMTLLREKVGTTPEAILGADPARLAEAAGLGILPENSVAKLRKAAEVAIRHFDGNVGTVLDRPAPEAKRALRKFPGIGEPGAEKILLLCGRGAFLAPDSNALRVLERLGYCASDGSYGARYGAAREVAERELGSDFDQLLNARHALRRHGQTICRNKAPKCEACPLSAECAWFAENGRAEA